MNKVPDPTVVNEEEIVRRYQTEPAFHALANLLLRAILERTITSDDLRDAVVMAAILKRSRDARSEPK